MLYKKTSLYPLKSAAKKFLPIMFVAALATTSIPTLSHAESTTVRIGLTKLAALVVPSIEADEFYVDRADADMASAVCMQTSSEPTPYRVSASSLSGESDFHVASDGSRHHIAYDVLWHGSDGSYLLHDADDMTDVVKARAGNGCDNGSFEILLNEAAFDAAQSGNYIDTLSLIFHVE